MSGEKHFWISQTEYNRLMKSAEKLRSIQGDLPNLIAGIRDQTRRDLLQSMGTIEDRQRQFDRAISGMSSQVRDLERGTSDRLSRQAKELGAAIAAAADRAERGQRDLEQQLADQDERLSDAIAEERAERERDLAEVRFQIEELVEHDERARQLARDWLRDAATLHDAIRDTLPHERFARGRLDKLRDKLTVAQANLDAGAGQAAIAAAQNAYHDLSDLRLDVEQLDREWRLVQAAAGEAVRTVQTLIDQNRVRKAVDEEGTMLDDVDLDVDHWTNGGLAALEQEANSLYQRVSDETAPMSTDELRTVCATTAPEWEARLEDLVQAAGVGLLTHHMRVSIGDTIAETLAGAYYEVVDGGWAGGDERAEFTAKLRHDDGSEVVVIVSNERVEVNSYDATIASETQRMERARAIHVALRDQGLPVTDPIEANRQPNPDVRDLVPILKKGQPRRRGMQDDRTRERTATAAAGAGRGTG